MPAFENLNTALETLAQAVEDGKVIQLTTAELTSAVSGNSLPEDRLIVETTLNLLLLTTSANTYKVMADLNDTSTSIVHIGGRWYMETNNRWISINTAYGHHRENHTQNLGTGSEPNVTWAQFGPILSGGDVVKRVRIIARAQNSQVTGMDIRVFHQYGPLSGTWDSNGETSRTVLVSADNQLLPSTDWRIFEYDVDITIPDTEDGFLIPVIRPVGTLTSRRYIYSTIQTEIIKAKS